MLYAPASSPFVITVGAVDVNGTADVADDVNAPWSSYGYTTEGFAKPEVAAPGRFLIGPAASGSKLITTYPQRRVDRTHMWMSGTSFAAPVVAGAAAEILARHPEWTADQVKGALMLTARPLPNAAPLSVGVGEIDAAAAASLATPPDGNGHLKRFLVRHPAGYPVFDKATFDATVAADASWASASWASASWASASWASASWASASWASASWASASWASASWASASWAS
jgi:serine protease AprX